MRPDGELCHLGNTANRSLASPAAACYRLYVRNAWSDDLLLFWNWSCDWRHGLAVVRRPLACAVSSAGGASWPLHRRPILEDGA